MAVERHIFPGNNTPKGFFSYYRYILGQREANRIYCIKGGPGVGKSSFMRGVAESFVTLGEDVDYMHCSSDCDSLDGIVLKSRKVALIDSTSPHMVDPITPGAVDSIIHLGEYWNEDKIRSNKEDMIGISEEYKSWFERAYNYLGAAEKHYDSMTSIYLKAVNHGEKYKIAAEIINSEFAHKPISVKSGNIKKYFASAITSKGSINYLGSLLKNLERVYVLETEVGAHADSIIKIIGEGAMYRGFDIEQYYCPIKPETDLEHVIIPELKMAVITVNDYHRPDLSNTGTVVKYDLSTIYDEMTVRRKKSLLDESRAYFDEMMTKTFESLKNAKEGHDALEKFYIPNMDFKKIDELRSEIVAKLI